MKGLLGAVIPPWAMWAALLVAGGFVFTFGVMRGERMAGERHIEYVQEQATQSAKIVRAQTKVVIQTEIEYRDRIQKIYVKGDVIEKEVPVYVTQADNDRCTINAGFVRSYNAAWTGEPAGPADDSDRGSSGVSLAEVGQADAHNATSCRAWREQVIGLRQFYKDLKLATDAPQ